MSPTVWFLLLTLLRFLSIWHLSVTFWNIIPFFFWIFSWHFSQFVIMSKYVCIKFNTVTLHCHCLVVVMTQNMSVYSICQWRIATFWQVLLQFLQNSLSIEWSQNYKTSRKGALEGEGQFSSCVIGTNRLSKSIFFYKHMDIFSFKLFWWH